MNKTISIFRLMRPAQWIKNAFVLLPVFLSGGISHSGMLISAIVAFLLFCLTSSAIYCINDAIDAPYDALNPDKCHRPVASGALNRREAIAVACFLLMIVGLIIGFSGVSSLAALALPIGTYFILNLGYSLWLKRVPVIDVLVIAGCFLLRIWAGAIACGIELTVWTLLLVFLLTLMLAVGKRRHEAWLCENQGIVSRSNIKSYDVRFLNWMLVIIGVSCLVIYFIWTESPYVRSRYGSPMIPATSIFVAVGIYRYLYLLLKKDEGGSPTKILLRDRVIQLSVLCWIGCFIFILY